MFKMTPLLLGNLIQPKATRPYPRETRPPLAGTRGRLGNRIEDCIFCGACALKCPAQCLAVDKQQALWRYDPFRCVYCGVCVENCPVHCLEQELDYPEPTRQKAITILKGTLKKKPEK
jgi:ech hydrogenase subunit F